MRVKLGLRGLCIKMKELDKKKIKHFISFPENCNCVKFRFTFLVKYTKTSVSLSYFRFSACKFRS